MLRPWIQSARAMHKPQLAESFMAIHRPLLARSCEVMQRPHFKERKGISTSKTSFNNMNPRIHVQGVVCQHAKIIKRAVMSQNKG